jgi:hypothetical protein
LEIEFGHLSETPKGWEERYEKQNHDPKSNRHQGKVRKFKKNSHFISHFIKFHTIYFRTPKIQKKEKNICLLGYWFVLLIVFNFQIF